jgi:hypothetical protein
MIAAIRTRVKTDERNEISRRISRQPITRITTAAARNPDPIEPSTNVALRIPIHQRALHTGENGSVTITAKDKLSSQYC